MRSFYLLLVAVLTSTGFAGEAFLPTGAYHLVSARDDGPAHGREVSARHVGVVEKEGHMFLTLEGVTVAIRTDEQGGVLFTFPVNERVRGAAVSQAIYVGRVIADAGTSPREEYATVRVEGFYRVVWPDGEEKGRFALEQETAEQRVRSQP